MVKLFVAVTDNDWFKFLRANPGLTEVNFWQPRGSNVFRALQPGELFLFKLHSPQNFIVGGGVFSHTTNIPVSVAWEAFDMANGAATLDAMRTRIAYYRREPPNRKEDYQIGCRILTQSLFFDEAQWIPVPASWSRNIVVGKTFTTDDEEGRRLWDAIESGLAAQDVPHGLAETPRRFGDPALIRPRLGQGAFRLAVTDAYARKCSVTRERVLPVLEAAHIKPYAEGGVHQVNNGLLLRRDIHRLFDLGYVTVAPDCRFEVSRRIHDDFDNGQEYYALHGCSIDVPKDLQKRPDRNMIEWHNVNRYLG